MDIVVGYYTGTILFGIELLLFGIAALAVLTIIG